jgi:hypothetical protein
MSFRKSAHDAPERTKPADVAPSYIPILDEHGNQRGHVHGIKSSEATVSRFGVRDARLKKIKGVGLAWQGISGRGSINADKRTAQLRQAKGSTTRHPTKPKTTARPKR